MGTLAFTTRTAQSREAVSVAPLTVLTKPDDWRAPGVAVTVGGFAGSGARVLLRADGHVVASTTAGKLGRYRLRVVPRTSGRMRLVVQSAGSFRPAGTLVVRPVSLDAVGDVTFGEEVGPALASHGGAYPWAFVGATLRGADITVGNLETAVSTRGVAAVKQFTFRGPPAALRPMREVAGFDVLTLANNHTVDFGRDALLDTVKAVRAAGIQTIGARRDRGCRRAARRSSRPAACASRSSATRTSTRTASTRPARHRAPRRPTSPRSPPTSTRRFAAPT